MARVGYCQGSKASCGRKSASSSFNIRSLTWLGMTVMLIIQSLLMFCPAFADQGQSLVKEGQREGLHLLQGSPTRAKGNMRNIRGLGDHGLIPRRSLFDKTHTVSYFHSAVGHHDVLYEHVEDLRKAFGNSLNIGDVSHSPVWTGYSIGVDLDILKQRVAGISDPVEWAASLLGLGGSYGQKQSRIERILGVLPKKVGDGVISEIVLSYIRSFPGIKSVHKSRAITSTRLSGVERLELSREKRRTAAGTGAFTAAIEKAAARGHVLHQGEAANGGTQRDPAVPLPWGLDRLDQESLPLDGKYSPIFRGTGINTFVVDSGLDTRHTEFSDGQSWHDSPAKEGSVHEYDWAAGSSAGTGRESPAGGGRIHRQVESSSGRSTGKKPREVRNLYDVYAGEDLFAKTGDWSFLKDDVYSFFPPRNNDHVGHGTHCAGTIAGKNVGVSPAANVYGVRVLNSQGSGDDESILLGLLYIYLWYYENDMPPTVINMSLGGTCASYEDCAVDTLVNAVEALSRAGIVVVVAAGNSACDACLETPAFAASAITVGASTIDDEAAFFSDYGKCVDIYAPGFNITSACASIMCNGKHTEYTTMSGTSMASPHTAGVVAQALELEILLAEAISEAEAESGAAPARRELILTDEDLKGAEEEAGEEDDEGATVAYLTAHSLSCLGAKMRLKIDRGEGNSAEKTTRNVIAQVPHGKPTYAAARSLCDLSASCRAEGALPAEYDFESSNEKSGASANNTWAAEEGRVTSGTNYNACSGHGYCQQSQCLCDTGYWGTNCSSEERGFSCSEGMQYVPYSLYDLSATGAGWAGAEYRILGPHFSSSSSAASSSYTSSIPVAASSMCGGITTSAGVCLSLVDDQKAMADTHEAVSTTSSGPPSHSSEQLSYALDVVPGAVGQGSMATWSMCGRMGSAPARWEVVVWPDNSSNSDMSVPGDGGGAIFTNVNAVFGHTDGTDDDDSDGDDGGHKGTPLPTRPPSMSPGGADKGKNSRYRDFSYFEVPSTANIRHNNTFCELRCPDRSAIGEVYFRLANLFDETLSTAAESQAQPIKEVLIGSQDVSFSAGYSLLDLSSGLELTSGMFTIDADFLKHFAELVTATLKGKDVSGAAKRMFPWVQTHSFCFTEALLAAGASTASTGHHTEGGSSPSSADSDVVSIDVAVIVSPHGADALSPFLSLSFCNANISFEGDIRVFRVTFDRADRQHFVCEEVAYSGDAAGMGPPSSANPETSGDTVFDSARDRLGVTHADHSAISSSKNYTANQHSASVQASTPSLEHPLRSLRAGIGRGSSSESSNSAEKAKAKAKMMSVRRQRAISVALIHALHSNFSLPVLGAVNPQLASAAVPEPESRKRRLDSSSIDSGSVTDSSGAALPYPYSSWGWYVTSLAVIALQSDNRSHLDTQLYAAHLSDKTPSTTHLSVTKDVAYTATFLSTLMHVNTTTAGHSRRKAEAVTAWRVVTSPRTGGDVAYHQQHDQDNAGSGGGLNPHGGHGNPYIPDLPERTLEDKAFWSMCGVFTSYRNSFKFHRKVKVKQQQSERDGAEENKQSSGETLSSTTFTWSFAAGLSLLGSGDHVKRLANVEMDVDVDVDTEMNGEESYDLSCERACLPLSATKAHASSGMLKFPHGEYDKPLAVLAKNDSKRSLEGLLSLQTHNSLCIGNATDNSAEGQTECHRLYLGAGTSSKNPLWSFCAFPEDKGQYSRVGRDISHLVDAYGKQLLPSTATVDFCVRDWTDCHVTSIDVPVCDGSTTGYLVAGTPSRDSSHTANGASFDTKEHAFYLMTYSVNADGWHGAEWYLFKAPPFSLKRLLSGEDRNADTSKRPVPPRYDDDTETTATTSALGGTSRGRGLGLSGLLFAPLKDNGGGSADDDGFASPGTDKGAAPTLEDDDAGSELGSDDQPFIHDTDVGKGYTLVSQGGMANHTGNGDVHTDVAPLCLTNGCYLYEVTKGSKAELALYVICGAIGTAGMGAYVGVYDGSCAVYSSLFFCQAMEALHNIASIVAPISFFLFLLTMPCVLALVFFCRRKGYPPETQPPLYRLVLDDPPGDLGRFMHNPLVQNSGVSGITSRSGAGVDSGIGQVSIESPPPGYQHADNPGSTGTFGESPASIEMSRLANSSTTDGSGHRGHEAPDAEEPSAPLNQQDSDLGMGSGSVYGALPVDGVGPDVPSLEGAVDSKTRQQRLRDAMNG